MDFEKLNNLFSSDMSIQEIANQMKTSKTNTRYWIKKYNLKRPINRDIIFFIDKEYLISLIDKLPIREISKEVGCSLSNIKKHIKKYNIELKKIKRCKFCNNKLTGKKSKNKFCNQECDWNWRFENTIHNKFINGLIKDSETIINIFKRQKKYKCDICENDGNWMDKILKLQVDHIDGDSNNNLPSNFRLLCPNCHTQTETWGRKNKKIGRKRLSRISAV